MRSGSSASSRPVLLTFLSILLLNIATAEVERTSALSTTSSTIITEPLQQNNFTRSTVAVGHLSSQHMEVKKTSQFDEHLFTSKYSGILEKDKTINVNSSGQIIKPVSNGSKESSLMVNSSLKSQASEPIPHISKDGKSTLVGSSAQGHAMESIPKVLKEDMTVNANSFVIKTIHATETIPQVSNEDKEIKLKSSVTIVQPSSQMLKNNGSEVLMMSSEPVQAATMTAKQSNPSAPIPKEKRNKNTTTSKVFMKPISTMVIQSRIMLKTSTALFHSKAKKSLNFVTSAITEQSKVIKPMRSFPTLEKSSYIVHVASNDSFTVSIPLNQSETIMHTIPNEAEQTLAASSTLKIPFSLNAEHKLVANFTSSLAYTSLESSQTSVKVMAKQKENTSSYAVADKEAVLISTPNDTQTFSRSEKSIIYSTVISDEIFNNTTTETVPVNVTEMEKTVLLKPSPSPMTEYHSKTALVFTSFLLNMTRMSFHTTTTDNNVITTNVGHSKTEDVMKQTLLRSTATQRSSEKTYAMKDSRTVETEFNMPKFSNETATYIRVLMQNNTKSRTVPKFNIQTSSISVPEHSITSTVRVSAGIISYTKDIKPSAISPSSTSSVHLRTTTSPPKLKEQQFLVTIKITSEQFKSEYINERSTAFKKKKREIENEFDEVFKDMPEYSLTEVQRFFNGSLGCDMIIHTESKESEPVTVNQVQNIMTEAKNSEGGFGKFVVGDVDVEEKNPEVKGRDDDDDKETWGKWPIIVISILGGICLVLFVMILRRCIKNRRYSHSLVETNEIREYSPEIELKNNDDYKNEERIPMTTFNQTDIY